MAKQLIDLSVAIEHDLPSDPPEMIPSIEYRDHRAGAEMMAAFYSIDDPDRDLPGGMGWATERVTCSTHSGTHMDAPWHYHPTAEGGAPAWTIDQVPLDWCMGDGAVLDFSDREDGFAIGVEDLEAAMDKVHYRPKARDIVLIRTGAMEHWGTPQYMMAGAGATREATLWLIEQGIRVVGTDAWSWDVPLLLQAQRYAKTGDSSIIWEGHFGGIERWYLQMEKRCNLHLLPPTGFTVICFPVKIKNASAGWVRAVAVVDK